MDSVRKLLDTPSYMFSHKVYRRSRYLFKHWSSQSFLCTQ